MKMVNQFYFVNFVAIFMCFQINREFMRITTVPLTSKFLSQLDECSDQLVKVFINKGGAAGKEIGSTIAVMDRVNYSALLIYQT